MKNILIVLVLAAVVFGYPIAKWTSTDTINIKVEKTERINDGESSRYLVYTDDETFENTDSILFFKFDSSDVYGHLKEGQTYTVKVAGWRWKLTSSYRNIISIQ